MRTQVIEITPETAKMWLEKNTRNRNLSPVLVSAYTSDMLLGKWSLTHQGIAFYEDGNLADGQHRLAAVVKSGCTIPFLVTFGIEKQSGADIDVHRARRALDAIKIGGLSDWINKDVIAIVNFLFAPSFKKLTPHGIVTHAEQYKDDIQFAVQAMSNTKKYITTAPNMAAVVKASINGIDKDRLQDFCHVLIGGITTKEGDIAALRFREYLLDYGKALGKSADSRKESHLKCQRAIKAFVNGERLSKLMTPSEDIYKLA